MRGRIPTRGNRCRQLAALALVALCACGGKPDPAVAPASTDAAPAAAATPAAPTSNAAATGPAGKTFSAPTFGVAACDRFASVLAACAPKLGEADFTTAKGAVDETFRSYRQSVEMLGAARSDEAFTKSCGEALARAKGAFAAACPDAAWDR